MIWCGRYAMYIAKPSEKTCLNCPRIETCYELNKLLQKAVEEGKAILKPEVESDAPC